ncbi:YbfB/YjiJ family MFS transporter [Allorhizobium terrae]|uniref:YbfB/YjiJ family MFS transporter n=1 Tax=Allorhizobium terrae TaxID=1848972 RepID=A0A4S4A5S5_9HYPH|nr:YbfB/YjiJ family MFS transporter [Allorhizobium terrae]THF53729.1 YbfB/YjiJ family MFS transporter [Allorhizobium terrae]
MSTVQSRRSLVLAAIAGALAMASAMGFGRFSFTPILPGMMTDLGLSASDAGLIASGNFAGYLVGAVLAGNSFASGRERGLAILSLLLNAVLLAAMALTSDVDVFVFVRFLSGVASAFSLIFSSSVVLSFAAGSEHAQSTHFGGVGFGIALSSLLVFVIGQMHGLFGLAGWRLDWLVGAAVSFAATILVAAMLPRVDSARARQAPEGKLIWTRKFLLLLSSYGLFGFGYVITATFIVTMARMAHTGAVIEYLSWFLAGLAAAIALFVWHPLMLRLDLVGAYCVALLLEAIGVFCSVALPGVAAPLVGGVALGATFMTITAYGLRLGRVLAPKSPRKALSMMTAAFGVGQIIGPLVAGAVAQRSGSFTLPSLIAAFVLLLSLVLASSLWTSMQKAKSQAITNA